MSGIEIIVIVTLNVGAFSRREKIGRIKWKGKTQKRQQQMNRTNHKRMAFIHLQTKQRIDKLNPKTTKHTKQRNKNGRKTTAQYSAVKMRVRCA